MSENEKVIVEMMIERLKEFNRLTNLLSTEAYEHLLKKHDEVYLADMAFLLADISALKQNLRSLIKYL